MRQQIRDLYTAQGLQELDAIRARVDSIKETDVLEITAADLKGTSKSKMPSFKRPSFNLQKITSNFSMPKFLSRPKANPTPSPENTAEVEQGLKELDALKQELDARKNEKDLV